MDSKVRCEFSFNHSCAKAAQRRILYRDSLRESTEHSNRTGCLIHGAAKEHRFLTVKATHERFPVTPSLWRNRLWVVIGLVADSLNYENYMSELMMNPSPHDWKIDITDVACTQACLSAFVCQIVLFRPFWSSIFPSYKHSKLLRLDYCRSMPHDYPKGWYGDADGLDSRPI